MANLDPAAFNARVEALTHELETSADVAAREHAKDLVALVLDFHRAGLERILEALGEDRQASERLVADPVVGSLLALHDLHAPAPPALIRIADRPPTPAQVPALPPAGGPPGGHGAAGCERCGAPLPEAHRHIVDVDTRRLSCSCRACWLLTRSDERLRSQRAVPDRYVHGPDLLLTQSEWDALQIPVEVAFFMFHGSIGRTIAFYPSPAGATESALPLDAWHRVLDANPWLRCAEPDVEALLVRRNRDGDGNYQCLLVPIDACYELVGRIRLHWTGFDGGDRVRGEIQQFFADVLSRGSGATVAGEVRS
jgi:hypothetical protein